MQALIKVRDVPGVVKHAHSLFSRPLTDIGTDMRLVSLPVLGVHVHVRVRTIQARYRKGPRTFAIAGLSTAGMVTSTTSLRRFAHENRKKKYATSS